MSSMGMVVQTRQWSNRANALRSHNVSIAPYLGVEIIPSPCLLKEKCILSTLLSSQFAYVDALNMNVKSCPKSIPWCLMLASELPRQCGGMLCLCPIQHLMCVWSHPILSYLILTRQQNPDDILDKSISTLSHLHLWISLVWEIQVQSISYLRMRQTLPCLTTCLKYISSP